MIQTDGLRDSDLGNDCLHYFRPASLNYTSQHIKMIYPELVEGLVPSHCYTQLHLQIYLAAVLIQQNSTSEDHSQ